MDKRKLIGTIIGVAMFAALIAGATFAFLSFTANVTNAIYYGNTMNFLVDYTQGTHIESLPQRVGSSTRGTAANSEFTDIQDVTPSNVARLVVVAKKHNNSVDGHVSIKFTTTQDQLNTDGLVNWIICRDPSVEDGTQVDNVCGSDFTNATNWGTLKGANETIMLNDAALANGKINNATQTSETSATKTHLIETDGVSYFVYFWIDSRKVGNQHVDKTFKGYIHSSATQIVE